MARKALTHLNAAGQAQMVDISAKVPMLRRAVASGEVRMAAATLKRLMAGDLPKGEALAVARIAGIQAAKKCDDLIPLCHSLPLDQVTVEFRAQRKLAAVIITATATTTAKTGVEMEALTAVSVAALTVYDMCKAIDKTMRIEAVQLLEKTKNLAAGQVH